MKDWFVKKRISNGKLPITQEISLDSFRLPFKEINSIGLEFISEIEKDLESTLKESKGLCYKAFEIGFTFNKELEDAKQMIILSDSFEPSNATTPKLIIDSWLQKYYKIPYEQKALVLLGHYLLSQQNFYIKYYGGSHYRLYATDLTNLQRAAYCLFEDNLVYNGARWLK